MQAGTPRLWSTCENLILHTQHHLHMHASHIPDQRVVAWIHIIASGFVQALYVYQNWMSDGMALRLSTRKLFRQSPNQF